MKKIWKVMLTFTLIFIMGMQSFTTVYAANTSAASGYIGIWEGSFVSNIAGSGITRKIRVEIDHAADYKLEGIATIIENDGKEIGMFYLSGSYSRDHSFYFASKEWIFNVKDCSAVNFEGTMAKTADSMRGIVNSKISHTFQLTKTADLPSFGSIELNTVPKKWMGKYDGYSGDVIVRRDLEIKLYYIGEDGTIEGIAYITPAQEEHDWYDTTGSYFFKGKIDTSRGVIKMKGYDWLEYPASKETSDWDFADFGGIIRKDEKFSIHGGTGNGIWFMEAVEEDGTDDKEDGTDDKEDGTDGKEDETDDKEDGTGDKEEIKETFFDVSESDFYYDAVLWALEHKVTSGYNTEVFGSYDGCTRGQIVSFLWRIAGSPNVNGVKNTFKDVSEASYYYKAVLWAVKQGITYGYTEDTFAPEEKCTRSQMVSFLWRNAGKAAPGIKTNPFKDVNGTDYYYEPVLWAVENKITSGVSANSFAPNATCSRAEAVTFLYRAYK